MFNGLIFPDSSLDESTRQKHEEATKMFIKLQTLEKGLSDLQCTVSDEPHPLLIPGSGARSPSPVSLLTIGPENGAGCHGRQQRLPDDIINAFDVMSMANHSTQFHGETAAAEVSP